MIIPPAIAHGRSDGFIAAAAAESRREENISGGFKILHGHEKKVKRNEMSGHVLPAFESLSLSVHWRLCPSVTPPRRNGVLLSTEGLAID